MATQFGYNPLPPPYSAHNPSHNKTTVVTVEHCSRPSVTPTVVLVGGCPSCRVGVLRKSHCTCCGVLWSILLFPFGLLCLLCCTKDRCSNCSYSQ